MDSLKNKIKLFMLSNSYKAYVKPVIIIAAIVLFLEIFIFNFRFYLTRGNNPSVVTDYTFSENVGLIDVNAFSVKDLSDDVYIEKTGLLTPINLIYVDFVDLKRGESGVYELKYHLELTDEGNAVKYDLPERTYYRQVTKTHFIPINPYGKVKSVRIVFDNLSEEDEIRINSFIINPKYSFEFSKKRVMFLFILLLVLWSIRPSAEIYKKSALDKFSSKPFYIALTFIFVSLLCNFVSNLDPYYNNVRESAEKQFMYYAESLVDRGDFFLDIEAPEELCKMEDPYDAKLRIRTAGEESVSGLDMSDCGFYKGKYFVYFGILPILMFYVPHYMIFGTHIMTKTVVLWLSLLGSAGIFLLYYEIIKRYFRKLPFGFYLLACFLASLSEGQLFLLITPDFYAVPILTGLMFTHFGLFFWFKALNKSEEGIVVAFNKSESENDCEGRLCSVCLLLGSLCMALVSAARPQFLLGSFLSIIIFNKSAFKDRKLFSKKSIKETLAFTVPYIVVAGLVMFYNYARFQNVFDFGANYNLTYNNMPYRGFHIDRLLHPLIGYFFYPCSVSNAFPYFGLSEYVSRYQGITADENLFGGIVFNNIYLLIVLFIVPLRKYFRKKEAYILAAVLPVFSVIIAVVDANMAGTLPRYYADFSWCFMISAFILLGNLYTAKKADINDGKVSDVIADLERQSLIRKVFYICFIVTLIRLLLMPFYAPNIQGNNINAFNTIKNLFEFWL